MVDRSRALEDFRAFFMNADRVRPGHFGRLGLLVHSIEEGRAVMELPFSPELVGYPETGATAGGAMTALLDSCCALAAATARETIGFCPTLDLRMDHMGLAEPNKPLIAEAEVYRVSQNVIFTRGIIHQNQPERPVVRGLVNFTPIQYKIGRVTDDSRFRGGAPAED